MPLIPSHQGLLAPLWRRWPERFNILALCIGAGMPDAFDGAAGLLIRGHLGQWYGHTLWGMHLLCVPLGLLLIPLSLWVAAWLQKPERNSAAIKVGEWISSGDSSPSHLSKIGLLFFLTFSMWVGVVSHVFFDLISHQYFELLSPWITGFNPIPEWWRSTWFTVSPPGYTNYSIGPHFMMWLFLSGLGIALIWPSRAQD